MSSHSCASRCSVVSFTCSSSSSSYTAPSTHGVQPLGFCYLVKIRVRVRAKGGHLFLVENLDCDRRARKLAAAHHPRSARADWLTHHNALPRDTGVICHRCQDRPPPRARLLFGIGLCGAIKRLYVEAARFQHRARLSPAPSRAEAWGGGSAAAFAQAKIHDLVGTAVAGGVN